MRISILQATLAAAASWALRAAAAPLAAQTPVRAPAGPAHNWASAFVVAYTGAGPFNNPVGSDAANLNETWNFGSGFGLGASAAHVIGQALQVGVEGSIAPSLGVEITDPTGIRTSDKARIGSLMATGRLMTGGGGGLGFYLHGGVGAILWGMPSGTQSSTDFAYRYGAGLEYQTSMRRAVFLQWGGVNDFHRHHGVSSNKVSFSQINGGIRIGW